MIVIVNSTPLIYLAAIGKFDLLRALNDPSWWWRPSCTGGK